MGQWNHHGISTEHGLSPLQLWTQGILRFSNNRGSLPDFILTDNEGYLCEVNEKNLTFVQDEGIVVPECNLPVSNQQVAHLRSLAEINGTRTDTVRTYIEIVDAIHHVLTPEAAQA